MRAKGPGQSVLLLLDVLDVLNKLHVPYAIIGAFAASFYGAVRASMDADAMISLRQGQMDVKTLIAQLQETGLKIAYRKGDFNDPIGALINIEDSFHNRVDLLMNIRGTQEIVFSRTVKADFMGTQIQLIGIEDFIALKVFAGSPKDINDVIGVLQVSYDQINLALLKQVVRNYGWEGSFKSVRVFIAPHQEALNVRA